MDLAIPVSVPTGVLAGVFIAPLLRPAVVGIPGRPWPHIATPALLATSALCAFVYRRAGELENDHTSAVYIIAPEDACSLYAILRLDPRSGAHASAMPVAHDGRFAKAADALAKRAKGTASSWARHVATKSLVFVDDGKLAGDGAIVRARIVSVLLKQISARCCSQSALVRS